MPGHVPPPVAAGFTLVEVVVALTILSLIMLATISALRTFGNTQSSLDRLTTRIDEVRTVSGFLRDTLQAAVAGTDDGAGLIGGLSLGPRKASTSQTSYFKGDSASLAWTAPVFFGEGYGGTLLVRVVGLEDTLLLQWQKPPAANTAVEWDQAEQRELLAGLEEFTVSYRADFSEPWQEEWKREDSPALVRMVIKAKGRYWPDLIMQVKG